MGKVVTLGEIMLRLSTEQEPVSIQVNDSLPIMAEGKQT